MRNEPQGTTQQEGRKKDEEDYRPNGQLDGRCAIIASAKIGSL